MSLKRLQIRRRYWDVGELVLSGLMTMIHLCLTPWYWVREDVLRQVMSLMHG